MALRLQGKAHYWRRALKCALPFAPLAIEVRAQPFDHHQSLH